MPIDFQRREEYYYFLSAITIEYADENLAQNRLYLEELLTNMILFRTSQGRIPRDINIG